MTVTEQRVAAVNVIAVSVIAVGVARVNAGVRTGVMTGREMYVRGPRGPARRREQQAENDYQDATHHGSMVHAIRSLSKRGAIRSVQGHAFPEDAISASRGSACPGLAVSYEPPAARTRNQYPCPGAGSPGSSYDVAA